MMALRHLVLVMLVLGCNARDNEDSSSSTSAADDDTSESSASSTAASGDGQCRTEPTCSGAVASASLSLTESEASYASPVAFTVAGADGCHCEACGCRADRLKLIEIFVDDVSARRFECNGGQCALLEFELELDPGPHDIGMSYTATHSRGITEITVEVSADDSATTGTDTAADSTTEASATDTATQ